MATVSLVPNALTAGNKRAMKAWLLANLQHAEFATGTELPIRNFGLYLDGEMRIVEYGIMQAGDMQKPSVTGSYILRVGAINAIYPPPNKQQRLVILGGIIGVFGLWEELAKEYSQAIGRAVLEAYNSCFLDMINAPQPAVKLAFSADKSQAAVQYQGDDAWFLNNGEPVVVDDSWHVVAA